jgi:cell division protein FtsL
MRKLIDEVEDVFKEIQEDNINWRFMHIEEIVNDNEFRAKNGRLIELSFS